MPVGAARDESAHAMADNDQILDRNRPRLDELFEQSRSRVDENAFVALIDEFEGHDIDTAAEFAMAEVILDRGLLEMDGDQEPGPPVAP